MNTVKKVHRIYTLPTPFWEITTHLTTPHPLDNDEERDQMAHDIFEQMHPLKLEAKDNLLEVKDHTGPAAKPSLARHFPVQDGKNMLCYPQHTGDRHTNQVMNHMQLSLCQDLMVHIIRLP
jgi:hypothetical protein